jgi:hypothetical protein
VNGIPVARGTRTSYENFAAECPWCDKESVFNRASDLGTFKPILGRDVSCLSLDCGRPFRIMGDVVNNAHEMLVFDCYELLESKHYMNCILSLAQAYEVFFSLFFRVELLYRPFASDSGHRLDDLNRLHQALLDQTRRYTFTPMRTLFLRHMVAGHSPRDLGEAATMVSALSSIQGDPSDCMIDGLADAKLVPLLQAVKTTRINEMRNDVVHKQAYRPNAKEALDHLEEARSVLFPLTDLLDLHDDINWYISGRPERCNGPTSRLNGLA